MLGIHRNPNWKEFLKSCESFLRKSQFSKLRYLNSGFGGPWDMLGIFFVNVIFITLQNKSLGQINFWIPCTGSKVPFWQFFNSGKMALLNPCMEFNYNAKMNKFFFILQLWDPKNTFAFRLVHRCSNEKSLNSLNFANNLRVRIPPSKHSVFWFSKYQLTPWCVRVVL